MKVEALDARKTAVLFNSSTFPRRFIGVREHHNFFCASRAGTRFKAVSVDKYQQKYVQGGGVLSTDPCNREKWSLE